MTSGGTRIAMWSGPRNISTAMMRSWEARGDTLVRDEPLYAHYLAATGRDHPGRDEVIATHEPDWRAVVAELTGPVPHGRPIFYQKHMAHHLLPDMDTAWVAGLVNCFLIRAPSEMITSLAKVLPDPSIEETGLPQQVRLFEAERARTGRVPPVLDARDVLTDPADRLARLCDAVGVAWTDAMLSWKPGRRPTDGVWARHWYASVEASTGFAPYRPKDEPVPDHLRGLAEACDALYHVMHEHRIV
jgi:hypothetical protein